MRRLLPFVVSLLLAGAACTGSEEPTVRPSAGTGPTTASTPSATVSPAATGPSGSPAPAVDPDVQLPTGVSPTVDDPADIAKVAAGDLAPLVPSGASYATRSSLSTPDDPIDQIAITWLDGAPLHRRNGLIVWQRLEDDRTWHAVYAFTDPARMGVFGIRVDAGDLTGDAIPDLLSFEDVGGSGACGTYRVVASTVGDATEILRRDTCDTQIAISNRDLRVREAVFEPNDPHCCPSAFRIATLHWDGTSWDEIASEVVPTDPNGR